MAGLVADGPGHRLDPRMVTAFTVSGIVLALTTAVLVLVDV